jgi:two-component sensor histidine kinase
MEKQEPSQAERMAMETARLLTKELHHRVFNNLQLLISLLDLQSRETSSPEAKEALRIVEARLKSIALVNEINIAAGGVGLVDALDLAKGMAATMAQVHSTQSSKLVIEVEGPSLPIPIDTAAPLVLIAAEFVNRSGYPEIDRHMAISWRRVKRGEIEINACGKGHLEDGSRRLIEALALQIGAKASIAFESGESVLKLSL